MSSILETSPVLPGTSPSTKTTSPAAWPAIIAGACVATGTTLILLSLGSGLGFAEVSPWENRGVSAATFTVTMAIWLIVTQWISSGMGGYIAGRLRTTWTGTHSHEVFFRDTANGLVTWAVSTLVIAVVAASSVFSTISGGVHSASSVVSGTALGAMSGDHLAGMGDSDYGIDRLFRESSGQVPSAAGMTPGAVSPGNAADSRAQATHIVANALTTGSMPDADRTYLAQLVAERTGAAPDEALKRVNDLWSEATVAQAKAKAAADEARAAAAQAAIYTALSLLIGAFIASVAAALGGRLRDEHP